MTLPNGAGAVSGANLFVIDDPTLGIGAIVDGPEPAAGMILGVGCEANPAMQHQNPRASLRRSRGTPIVTPPVAKQAAKLAVGDWIEVSTIDMNYRGTVISGADVTDVGLAKFIGADPSQKCSEDASESYFSPAFLATRTVISRDLFE